MSKVLKENWMKRMVASMCCTHPDVPREKIERIVERIYDKRVINYKVSLYNDYEQVNAGTNALDVVDWMKNNNPLITESGVFFYQKSLKPNVNVSIIKESMLDRRKVLKKEMFKAIEAGDEMLAARKDLSQANAKKAANSGYGAEGESSSFLHNKHSAMSVTASGRGQISTACQCFENLLADNVKFFDMSEFFNYVWNIVYEEPEWKFKVEDYIDIIPSREQFVERFKNKFGHETLYNETMIGQVYDSLDEDMICRVYYKCNLMEFIALRKPMVMLGNLANTNTPYVDPNDIPDKMKKGLEKFSDVILEFVGYKYGVFRYEDRTKYMNRKVVIVIDTDSNMIYYGFLMDYLFNQVLPKTLKRSKEKWEEYELRVLNILSDFTTKAITERLFNYLGVANVPEEDIKFVNMKNEFHMRRMIITFAKKSYIGLQYRQESTIFAKPKLDVKGVNFFKSTASEDTSKFIYDEILMKRLLTPKDGTISLMKTYRDIHKFQQQMYDEIKRGNMGYLKRSIRVKSSDGYADPMRIGQYKAVFVWNYIMPETEAIDLPNTVTLVKVQLASKKDLVKLERWPKIYKKLMELFDTNPDIGDYVDSTGKTMKGKGIKAIALPVEYDEVPEWLLSIIDVDTLIADNMALLQQLYRPLGFSKGSVSKNGTATSYYTNIIRI